MTDVTRDMLVDYMKRKGGRVKNVDLVKHFRKYLLFGDAIRKERAREDFKEKVNAVAVIKQEQGEKFLYLKETGGPSSRQSTSPPPVSPPPPPPPVSPPLVSSPPVSPLAHSSDRSTVLSRVTSLSYIQQNGDRYSSQTTPTNNNLTNGGIHTQYQSKAPSQLSPFSQPSSPPAQMSNTFSAISSQPSSPRPVQMSSAFSAISSQPSSPPPVQMSNAFSAISSPSNAQQVPPTGRRPAPMSPASSSIKPQTDTSKIPAPMSTPFSSIKPQTDPSRRTAPVPPSKPPSGFMAGRQRPVAPPPPLSTQPAPDVRPVVGGGRRPAPLSPAIRAADTHTPSLFSPLTSNERRPAPSVPLRTDSRDRRSPPPRPPQRAQLTSIVQLDESPGMRRASPTPPPPTITSSSFEDSSSFLDQMTSELSNIGSLGLFSDNFMFGSDYTPSSASSSKPSASSSKPTSSTSPKLSSHTSPATITSPQPPPTSSFSSAASLLSPSSPSSSSSLSSATAIVPSPSHDTPQSVQHLIKQYTPSSGNFPTTSSSSSAARQESSIASLSVRRESTPPDSHHVHRTHSNAASGGRRRGNLDTLTRRSIQNPGLDRQELLAHRLSKTSDELDPHLSREALSGAGDSEPGRDSPMSSEDYFEQIDPVEKEWAHALIDGHLDVIHRLILSDASYINKKGFLNGWTALHWAAKLGSQDMVNVLILSGALVDIKSNGGMTPLHLACEAGNDDVIKTLVREHNASVNARDHSGKRPMDILNDATSQFARSLLRNGLRYYAPPTEVSLSSFAIVRKSTKQQGPLSFNVPHTNLRRQGRPAAIRHVNEKRRGTISLRKFSFRKRKYTVDARKDRTKSNPPGHFDQLHNN